MRWLMALLSFCPLHVLAADYTAGDGCASVSHQPAADLHTDQPVTADGRRIAPADASPPVIPPDYFSRQYVEMVPPLNGGAGDNFRTSQFGEVEIGTLASGGRDNRVYMDGIDISPLERSEYDPDCAPERNNPLSTR